MKCKKPEKKKVPKKKAGLKLQEEEQRKAPGAISMHYDIKQIKGG